MNFDEFEWIEPEPVWYGPVLLAAAYIVASVVLGLLIVALVGCGGGGDDQDEKQTINPPNCMENPKSCV